MRTNLEGPSACQPTELSNRRSGGIIRLFQSQSLLDQPSSGRGCERQQSMKNTGYVGNLKSAAELEPLRKVS